MTVDASTLPGSGLARVRVQASDGFLTGSDTSDVTFTIASKGPEAIILSPQEAIAVALGSPLSLQGYGFDLEDGTLADTALAWSSNLVGPLATGGEASVTLSEGQHTVTFTVTDSANNPGTATVEVMVIEALPPQAPQVDIGWDVTGLTLSWPHIVADTASNPIDVDLYQVWRSSSPYFDPYSTHSMSREAAVPDGAGSGTVISYLDTEAAANPDANYYYFVRAISSDGMMSDGSNRVGAFSFSVAPGS